jgi:hypothetical protein
LPCAAAPGTISRTQQLDDTPRHCTVPKETLSEVRGKVERHIRNTYLKSVQAPVGIQPTLKAWMELS